MRHRERGHEARWSSTAALIATLSLLTAVGCDVEAGPGVFPPQDVSRGLDDVGVRDGSAGAGPGTGSMDGTWLLVGEDSNCLELIGVEESIATTFYLVRAEQDGMRVREEREICAVDITPNFGLQVVIPPAALDAVNPVAIEDGFVNIAGITGGYASGLEVQIWGVELDDPLADPMPTSLDDERVIDADGDGFPGVTFVIDGGLCEMRVVQRHITRFQGLFTTPNQIDGTTIARDENLRLDATSPLCRTNAEIFPNDAHSRFRMIRVDGRGGSINLDDDGDGEITCDEIRAAREGLWTTREPDNANCEAPVE